MKIDLLTNQIRSGLKKRENQNDHQVLYEFMRQVVELFPKVDEAKRKKIGKEMQNSFPAF